jgi:uncharacterized protein
MIQPVLKSERILLMDALRGFALLGILMVNWMIMSWPQLWTDMLHLEKWTSSVDKAAIWLIHYLFEFKFFSLFSFLFGLGFALQFLKAETKGGNFAPYYLRRQILLLLIGACHALLLWPGDFLVLYALQGMLLLLFRKAKEQTLLVWSAIFFLIPLLLSMAFYGYATSGEEAIAQLRNDFEQVIRPDLLQHIERSYAMYPSENTADVWDIKLNDTKRFYESIPFWWWNSFAMFLLGLYAGKRKIFQRLDELKPILKKWWVVTSVLGFGGNVLFVWAYHLQNVFVPNSYNVVYAFMQILSVPTLTLFYVCSFCLLAQRVSGQKLLHLFAPMGKIALSCYVMQSLLVNLILFGFGLGLYGKISPAQGLLWCLGIYGFQLVFSHWYIRRFSYGPLEWIWRKLTYSTLKAEK